MAWIYGEVVTVREVAREPLPATMASTDDAEAIRARLREAKLDPFVDAADAAFVGTVTRVSSPPSNPRGPITEHDPQWREAVVTVQSWIKGGSAKRVTVRFPASVDVAWHDVPKLETGTRGTFLVHLDPVPIGTQRAPTYRIQSPLHVLPVADAPVVRKLTQQ